jgi:hypothetical protein
MDPKELLGKAFGEEPPLRLDREEIVQRGRRQVRIRRFATSGGVAAAVVAVVLGAAVLPNLGGGGTDDAAAPPASVHPTSAGQPYPPTTPTTAPQGPQLPLSTPATPVVDRRADELTRALADASLIPNQYHLISQADGSTPLAFIRTDETYQATANLQDDRYGGGDVRVAISRVKSTTRPVDCASLGGRSLSCSVVNENGLPMVQAVQQSDGGVVSNVVQVVRPDGTEVLVVAANAFRDRTGIVISGSKPPLDFAVLTKIAALPRLSFG